MFNKIEEIKNGFAADKNSQKNFLKIYADVLIKSIAYNLFNFFKQVLLPADLVKGKYWNHKENICQSTSNIVKKESKKFTVRLPKIGKIKEIVENIKERLYMFAFRDCYSKL